MISSFFKLPSMGSYVQKKYQADSSFQLDKLFLTKSFFRHQAAYYLFTNKLLKKVL